MSHKIILPNQKNFENHADSRISQFTRCLKVIEIYIRDTIVEFDEKETLKQRVPPPVFMANDNGRYSSFFLVDDHLFMIIDTDHPIKNHQEWVKHYENNGVKGYFLINHRHSTKFIFDDCKVPIFTVAGKPGPSISLKHMEHDAHSKSKSCKKDINVFFCGRFNTRATRRHIANLIEQNIPNVQLINGKNLSSDDYINLMSRAKIAWCPRSVWSRPDKECNAPVCKEFEAMCLEVAVLKPPIGTLEIEPRIPGVHYIEVQNHSLDLIEKIQYYLEHDDEREKIAHNGRLYFERNCSVGSRACRIFNDCMKAING